MSNDTRPYRAICFDLDGTLLPMDIEEFMSKYFARISAYVQASGFDGKRFMEGLGAGTKAMATHDDDRTNAEAFWETFYGVYDVPAEDRPRLQEVAERFYAEDFAHIGDGFVAPPDAADAVRVLREKGYPLILTTMPMFPEQAVWHRLGWAGIEPDAFERITHYENSKSVKPHLAYFAENLAAMGLVGEDVLMVGNNTLEDFAFQELGADAYLITDWLLDPIDRGLAGIRHGSMADFREWVAALPDCADPVTMVETGPIAHDAMLTALEESMAQESGMTP